MNTIDERLSLIIDELQTGGITLEEAADAFDAKYITAALKRCGGNITRASRLLGVHRNTVQSRLRENEALRTKPRKRIYGQRKGRGA